MRISDSAEERLADRTEATVGSPTARAQTTERAVFACLLTRWWPMAAALASTSAGTAATPGGAPGAGPRTRRGWPPSGQTPLTKRKNRSSPVSRRRASPPPGEWRCRTRQRQAAVRGGASVAAGRSADDGTDMRVRDSGIVAGQANYLLAACGRLSSRACILSPLYHLTGRRNCC